jgi:hypothetical protein
MSGLGHGPSSRSTEASDRNGSRGGLRRLKADPELLKLSNRAIASEIGVAKDTIQRARAFTTPNSPVSNETPDDDDHASAKVIGIDGKAYPATATDALPNSPRIDADDGYTSNDTELYEWDKVQRLTQSLRNNIHQSDKRLAAKLMRRSNWYRRFD